MTTGKKEKGGKQHKQKVPIKDFAPMNADIQKTCDITVTLHQCRDNAAIYNRLKESYLKKAVLQNRKNDDNTTDLN
ncbi:hypothetical protein JRQ81_000341 [Phrynocephalus forsythii]|uniref:Uncharacterized protein n=1 Tax=Phrynocephalus forsythii TaxID=171643 RepID=A0A9Q0Y6D0_9SAUR|nr:hypothetical protein JRQ81_000341 [Phrynocephalus forsythii]